MVRLESQRLTVIGGGTGCNTILSACQESKKTTFIVPVSDDGGSTAEILRVLGGPALGDIRSRLVRLIPPSSRDSPLHSIRTLFEYRLPSTGSSYEIKGEWHTIVEGTHQLWRGIPVDRREAIRAFLVYFEGAVLKKAQRGFDFRKASIGNLFLSGASLFLGSVPSAIFLFASLTGIPHETFAVVPVINTSSTVTIAAELENGSIIAGQSEISHPAPTCHSSNATSPSLAPAPSSRTEPPPRLPVPSTSYFPLTRATTPSFPEPPVLGAEEDDDARPTIGGSTTREDARTSSDQRSTKRSRNLDFSKDSSESPPLEARISRIFYLNQMGHEIFPRPNGLYLESLRSSTSLVYAPGSLYTSILPCLALESVGTVIATSTTLSHKILLLNSTTDRETPDYSSLDFIRAISQACNRAYGLRRGPNDDDDVDVDVDSEKKRRYFEPKDFVTDVVYLEGSQVVVETDELEALGIRTIRARATATGLFDDEVVKEALERIFSSSSE